MTAPTPPGGYPPGQYGQPQPYPGQYAPGQPYPGQAQPGQPYPGQAQPGQPYPPPASLAVPAAAGPPTATIGLGRSNASMAVLLLIFFVAWVVVAVKGGIESTDSSSRAISYALAAVGAVLLALVLRALPKFLSPRSVLVNPQGLAIQHGKEIITVGWHEISAVGIGYALAAGEKPKSILAGDSLEDVLKERLSDAAGEALQVSGKRQFALEIFPARLDAGAQHPRLKPYWKQLPPPAPGLPSVRWQFPLPPVASITDQVGRALQTLMPRWWIGYFPVAWRGKP